MLSNKAVHRMLTFSYDFKNSEVLDGFINNTKTIVQKIDKNYSILTLFFNSNKVTTP